MPSSELASTPSDSSVYSTKPSQPLQPWMASAAPKPHHRRAQLNAASEYMTGMSDIWGHSALAAGRAVAAKYRKM